ncbi:hypothetical protein BASA50_003732 [Batrachochytrium salamandrivorans]|uniref:SAM domain-containing protein n=1 Tax=Batrachochytrium salamandrivorans TaxID=1357716 RepID=A0ABQ8FIA5_9FUNG|nr:hypothetical protein BASA62_009641 [Batrachochytrium salamandrivorans]KAH6598698.1 hypothetical protein BASA50_003732 [Batrachochytrium salamandrivorans]
MTEGSSHTHEPFETTHAITPIIHTFSHNPIHTLGPLSITTPAAPPVYTTTSYHAPELGASGIGGAQAVPGVTSGRNLAHISSMTLQYGVVVQGTDGSQTAVRTAVIELLRSRFDEATQTFKCQISYTMTEPSTTAILLQQAVRSSGQHEFTFHVGIIGPYMQVIACRAALLRSNTSQTLVSLKATRHIILSHNGEMRPVARRRFDNIMKDSLTHISCVAHVPSVVDNASVASSTIVHSNTTLSSGDAMNIDVVGQWDAVERARMSCLLLLDELFGLSCTSVQLDCEMHPIVAGLQRSYFNLIMHETLTSIYLPTPLVALPPRSSLREPSAEGDVYPSTIYITGPPDGVARARDLLFSAVEAKNSKVLTKHVPCLPRKIDWLYMYKKKEIRKIIYDNATYISFPPLGSNSNILTFFGEFTIYMERAVRALMQLVCEYYISYIQLQPIESPQQALQYLNDIQPKLLRIARNSGSEIVVQRQFIEIYGLEHQVKQAYQELLILDQVKNSIRDTKFQIELAIEHRDFINGKKNGKVNKIIKAANCRIVFQDNYNDYNMLIDLYSPTPSRTYMGLQMLQDELPAEVSFYIPETYHKRIIGVGGKNIQKIMKRYGVYVKFSSFEEYAALGGHYENEDNVIARTPAKNSGNLKDLKFTICDSIKTSELIEAKAEIDVPRQLHGILAGYQGRVILDIEASTKARVSMPDRESGLDTIVIEGPESQLDIVRHRIHSCTPSIFDFDLLIGHSAQQAVSLPEFGTLINQLKDEGIRVNIYLPQPAEIDPASELTVFLIYSSLPLIRLEDAKRTIVTFVSRKQALPTNVTRASSFAILAPLPTTYDTFQHFNSQLIAASTPSTDPSGSVMAPNFSLFGGKQGSAISVPNLRQIFDDAPNMPPGLKRSGSEVKPQPSAIGRPRNYATSDSQMSSQASSVRMLSESADFLRHTHLNRQSLTMPDLLSFADHPSASISNLLGQGGLVSDPSSAFGKHPGRSSAPSTLSNMGLGTTGSTSSSTNMSSCWGAPSHLGQSIPPSVLGSQDASMGSPQLRPHSSFISHEPLRDDQRHGDYLSMMFDPKISDTATSVENRNPNPVDDIAIVLDRIAHSKYLPNFIEHEIDFPTFLTLEDGDLKELGIKALGSRKKILAAIGECRQEVDGLGRSGSDADKGGASRLGPSEATTKERTDFHVDRYTAPYGHSQTHRFSGPASRKTHEG